MNPIGPINAFYPKPTSLVGATVNAGELVQTYADPGVLKDDYADPGVLKDDKIDIEALRPLLFAMAGKKYWSLGPAVGNCWHAGKSLKKERAS